MNAVALVTGGSSGIGRETALLLQNNGYKVYELSRTGQTAHGVTHLDGDVTKADTVRQAVDRIIQEEGRIDLLVNNAGFGISGAVECTSYEDAHRQFEVNFFGQLYSIQAVLPYMRKAQRGCIINLSSVAAPIAIPFQGFYSATKAAINSMTLSLRNEVRPFHIKVCAVQPGDVKTGFTAARMKSHAGDDVYGDVLTRSVSVMEHDEKTGMPPAAVAGAILKAAGAKNPKALYTVGAKYRLFTFLNKILPTTLVNYLVGKMYQ